jgi:hypothetical protein
MGMALLVYAGGVSLPAFSPSLAKSMANVVTAEG